MTQPAIDEAPSVPLILFYGQSWICGNGYNGRVIDAPLFPENALMLAGTGGLVDGAKAPAGETISARFLPAQDLRTRVQSVVTPFLFRYVKERLSRGDAAVVAGHAVGPSGARIAHLLPADDPDHEPSHAYDNLMTAVRAHVGAAAGHHKPSHVPFLVFCHGAGDRAMAAARYQALLARLIDRLGTDIRALTGQQEPPHVLILQPPGKASGGAWPCLQAQVDMCLSRPDMTLALAGWAVDQHDRTHFSGRGAVMAGELLALTADRVERGLSAGAPVITGAALDPHGQIEMSCTSTGPLVADTSVDSPRHRVGDAPVPGLGLECPGHEIGQVTVDGTRILVTLADPPGQGCELRHAYHAGGDRRLPRYEKRNQSANRGNIRLAETWHSEFLDATLKQWLASTRTVIGD